MNGWIDGWDDYGDDQGTAAIDVDVGESRM